MDFSRCIDQLLTDLRLSRRNFNLKSFFVEVGVSDQTLRNWRSGKHLPSESNVSDLVKFVTNCKYLDEEAKLRYKKNITSTARIRKKERPNGGPKITYGTVLHLASAKLLSRPSIDSQLDSAIRSNAVVAVYGEGGIGKTTLVTNWLARGNSASNIFIWSFYKQGQPDSFASADELVESLYIHLWGGKESYTTGERILKIGERLRRSNYVLVIDGCELLQFPPSSSTPGALRDTALEHLLLLSSDGVTKFLLTSRIKFSSSLSIHQIQVPPLTTEESVQLAEEFGISTSEKNSLSFIEYCKGHSLTLQLLCAFVAEAYEGVAPPLTELISDIEGDGLAQKAARVLQRYLAWLPSPESTVLLMLGIFSYPVSDTAVMAIARASEITAPLSQLSTKQFLRILSSLAKLGLFSYISGEIDTHPLVKSFLAAEVRHTPYWKRLNSQAFSIFSKRDDSYSQLQAVKFGVAAGLSKEAFRLVYATRFSCYLGTLKLQGISRSVVLASIFNFFDNSNDLNPVPGLSALEIKALALDILELASQQRGYAAPLLRRAIALAQCAADGDAKAQLRILYAQCRFQRMAGNFCETWQSIRLLRRAAAASGEIAATVGFWRNVSAFLFYKGKFRWSLRCALRGQPYLSRLENWRDNSIGFVNDPHVMLSGYVALSAALLGDGERRRQGLVLMREAAATSPHLHSRAMASFIECILAEIGGHDRSISTVCGEFRRLAYEGDLIQWSIAADIFQSYAANSGVSVFSECIKRWISTGSKLFCAYWHYLAAKAAENTGETSTAKRLYLEANRVALDSGETWVAKRIHFSELDL